MPSHAFPPGAARPRARSGWACINAPAPAHLKPPRWRGWLGLGAGWALGWATASAQLLPPINPLAPSPTTLPNPIHDPATPFGLRTGDSHPTPLPEQPSLLPSGGNATRSPAADLSDLAGLPVDALLPDSEDPALQPLVEPPLPEPGQPLPGSEAVLDKIMAVAATDSSIMREQGQLVDAANADRFRSWMRYLPTVNARYNVGFFDDIRADISNGQSLGPGASYTLDISRPLYYWGAVDATEKLGLLREKIAKNDAIIAYAKLCVTLRKEFYTLVAEKSSTSLLAAQVETAQRRAQREQELRDLNQTTQTRVDELEFLSHELANRQAEEQIKLQGDLLQFRRDSGTQTFELPDVPDYVVIPAMNVTEMRAEYKAFTQTGFVASLPAQGASLRLDALDQEIIINDANQKPNFNIGAGITQGPYQSGGKNAGVYFQTILFFGITGSWDIFDNDETRSNGRALLDDKRRVDGALSAQRRELFDEAENQLSIIESSQHSIAIARIDWANLQVDYRSAKQLVAEGQGDQTQLDQFRDSIIRLKSEILQNEAQMVAAYYIFLTTIFVDPALTNVDTYKQTPP